MHQRCSCNVLGPECREAQHGCQARQLAPNSGNALFEVVQLPAEIVGLSDGKSA
jgi:hypothetical protein